MALVGLFLFTAFGAWWTYRQSLIESYQQGMSAEEREDLRRFLSGTVRVPEEWRRLEPFPEELLALSDRFIDLAKVVAAAGVESGTDVPRSPNTPRYTYVGVDAEIDSMIGAAREMVSNASYEFAVLAASPAVNGRPPSDVLFDGIWSRVQGSVAEGNTAEAVDQLRLLFNLGKTRWVIPHSPWNLPAINEVYPGQLVGYSWSLVSGRIHLLLHSLDGVGELEQLITIVDEEVLPPVRRWPYWEEKWSQGTLMEYLLRQVPVLPKTVSIAEWQREFMNSILAFGLGWIEQPVDRFWFRMEMYFTPRGQSYLVNEYQMFSRHNTSSSRYNNASLAHIRLLRLAIANRIIEIETGAKATSSTAFVPRFFPEEPLDPFSDKPFLWDALRQRFYSVGRNGVDDGGQGWTAEATGLDDVSLE